MKAIRGFGDFVKRKIVKVQSPDKSRAEFLLKGAENSHFFLQESIEKIGLRDENANEFVKSCYDVLMELIRAKMMLGGFNAVGQGAHEAEVSYLRVLGFTENEVQFANQLRFFRNGMLYYGTALDKEYAEKVVEFTAACYKKLTEILKIDIGS